MRTKIIGLVGGVASGKSKVAELFQRLGAEVLDADAAGHEVLALDEVKQAIRARWGNAVFGDNGEVDRARLAAIVFSQADVAHRELAFLEQLTHPRIGERLWRRAAELSERGDVPAVVLDAAVMLKAGWDRMCDAVLFVEAPRDVRRSRSRSRGWSDADFDAREAAQESLHEKRRRADEIIDNSGPLMSTQAQVARAWERIVGFPSERPRVST